MKNKILLLAAVMMIAGCQREEMQQARSYSAVTEGFEQSRTSLDEDTQVQEMQPFFRLIFGHLNFVLPLAISVPSRRIR